MKKILSIISLVLLAFDCFATGTFGVNPPQQGTIAIVTNGATSLYYTNTFPAAYQSVPVVLLFNLGNTNALPMTNTVTTTNFVVELNTPTNTIVNWSAYIGTPRIYAWTPTNQTVGVATNILFPFAYAYPPVVVVTPQNTNGAAAVSSVTTTGFTLLENTLSTNQVIVFGIWASPSQADNTQAGYNDVNY